MRGVFAAALISLTICAAAPWFGPAWLSISEISDAASAASRIFWRLRLPRVLLGWCAGAVFGAGGAVFQTMFRNRLAEPSLLGVSSGASLGAALAIKMGLVWGTSLLVPTLFAFVGAMIAVGLMTAFAAMSGSARDARILLAGAAVNALFSSVITVIQFTGGEGDLFRMFSWTLGGIYPTGMSDALWGLAPAAIVMWSAISHADELDILSLGEDEAASRGVDTVRVRRMMFVSISASLALIVSRCGPIAFLGLFAPWIARRTCGHLHRHVIAASAAFGGGALVLCDAAARTLWAPADLPAGLIVSLGGAPFFLYLLFARRDR